MSDEYEELPDAHEEGTADDCAVDFKFGLEGPAICAECGKQFPIHLLDRTDSEPLCPRCKYIDWDDSEQM